MDGTETPEIYKTMVLSTAHVAPEDCKRLDELTDSWTTGVTRRRDGYRIDLDNGGWREKGPMSILFEAVLEFACDHGCCVLELDPDARVMACLAEGEWP